MPPRPLRQIRTLWRFFVPPAADRAYERAMAASGQFDRDWYLASNPRMHPLFRLNPARHYVQHGETIGLCPNPGFSPRAYLYHNPDLAAGGVRPLWHYITEGAGQNRTVLHDPGARGLAGAVLPQAAPLPRPAPFAVVLHVYYAAFWDEVAPLLEAQLFPFDLLVTLTDRPGATDLADRIRARFAAARVWILPNLGRDIFPFVWLAGAGVLAPYRAVCKLHSKKSPHRADGDDWRRMLVAGVLGDPATTRARLEIFLDHPRAGFWTADGQHYTGDDWWGPNRDRAAELLARAGLDLPAGPLSFAAGSIYWMAPAMLAELARLDLGPDDFEAEQALVDGTTAHAMERVLGCLAAHAGLAILAARDLDSAGDSLPSKDRA